MTEIKVAAVQFELRREASLDQFRDHVADVVRQAVAQGAELVLLPELATTGLLATHTSAETLTADDLNKAYRDVFPGMTSRITETLLGIAAEHGVWLAGGSHWRQAGDGSFRNTAYLAHPDGGLDLQDKLHLTWPEVDLGTTPGDGVAIFSVRGDVEVAIQICADIEFAEVTRALALAGADIVLCPSMTWNTRGANRVKASCLARSVEQQVVVVQAPLIGTSDIPHGAAMFGKGHAQITVPVDRNFGYNDGVAAACAPGAEGVAVATVDIDKLRRTRRDSDSIGLRHARPELYRTLDVHSTTRSR